MSGNLSQAVANLQTEEQFIKALVGLPADAVKIQTDSANLIASMATLIQRTQADVTAFVGKAQSPLKSAETKLSGSAPLSDVKKTIEPVIAESNTLNTALVSTTSEIEAAVNRVAGYSNQLATIEAQLNAQKAVLVGQMNAARGEAEAQKKNRWYYLLLGPFGIAGAATALGLMIAATNKANDLESSASALNAQINRQNALVSTTKQLGTDFVSLSSKILMLKNSIGMLSGDLSEVDEDLEQGRARLAIELLVKTAETEVSTLAADAS